MCVIRNLYIDLIKGIACIGVIFIHTSFWSGVSYVPDFFRSVSLLIDVPIFFLLSGLTTSINIKKNFIRLGKLQLSYMFFVTLIYFIHAIYTQKIDVYKLLLWWVHDYSDSFPLPVVMGSMWYLKIYFFVAITAQLVLKFIAEKYYLPLLIILFTLINFLTWIYRYESGDIDYVVFYLFIFMLGYYFKNKNFKITYLYFTIALVSSYFIIFYILGIDIYLDNIDKFPPNIIYLLYSLFSLTAILYLKDKIVIHKSNFLIYIGKNAIYYYFAQGISASIIFLFVYLLRNILDWATLLPMMFITNLILAIIFAEGIKKLDKLFFKLF
ncbi:acyltransferase [Apibacter muscae]|nr:acyltransferase [Apibacter muscae]